MSLPRIRLIPRTGKQESSVLCRCEYCGHRFLVTPEKAREEITNLKCPQCMAPLSISSIEEQADSKSVGSAKKKTHLFTTAVILILLAGALLFPFSKKATPENELTGEALIESLRHYITTDVNGMKSYTVTKENFSSFYDVDTGDYKIEDGENGPEIIPGIWLRYTLKPELQALISPEDSSVKVFVEGSYMLTPILGVDWESGKIKLGSKSSTDLITDLQDIIIASGGVDYVQRYNGVFSEGVEGVLELPVPLNNWSRGAWRVRGGIKGPISPLSAEDYVEESMCLPQLQKVTVQDASGKLQLKQVEGLQYRIEKDQTATIIRYSGTEENLRLPLAVDGYSVIEIGGSAFEGCESLRSVIVPDGIRKIAYRCFSNCPNLTSVTLPDSVVSIDHAAFSNCKMLKEIRLPSHLTEIPDFTFQSCSALAEISVPDGIQAVGEYAFSGCAALQSLDLPEGVASIGKGAFNNCESLTSVSLPSSLRSIGYHSFAYCSSLKRMAVPDGVTGIEAGAFSDCTSLAEVSLPAGLTAISDWTFSDCHALTSIIIPDSVESIGESAFFRCPLAELMIPDGVTSLGENSFSGCTKLESVKLPANLTSIGDSAFHDCGRLADIQFPDSLRSIGKGAFHSCSGLSTIHIPESVTTIGDGAFSSCSGLLDIELPSRLTAISPKLLHSCFHLRSVVIPGSVVSIGDDAFSGCSRMEQIKIPDSVTSIGLNAFDTENDLTLIVGKGSYAEQYCEKYRLACTYSDSI